MATVRWPIDAAATASSPTPTDDAPRSCGARWPCRDWSSWTLLRSRASRAPLSAGHPRTVPPGFRLPLEAHRLSHLRPSSSTVRSRPRPSRRRRRSRTPGNSLVRHRPMRTWSPGKSENTTVIGAAAGSTGLSLTDGRAQVNFSSSSSSSPQPSSRSTSKSDSSLAIISSAASCSGAKRPASVTRLYASSGGPSGPHRLRRDTSASPPSRDQSRTGVGLAG